MIKETPRNLALSSKKSAKYRNPEGAARYFAPARRRRLVDENCDSFEVSALELQKELCPLLWNAGQLDPRVRKALIKVTNQFIEFLGVGLKIKDVIIAGSMAAYNWNDKSDIDVHVLVDYRDIDAEQEVVSELFSAKKDVWNTRYTVRMKGHDVEMYVQDINEDLFSQGVFSLARGSWVKKPVKTGAAIDVNSAKIKACHMIGMIDNLDDIKDGERKISRVEKVKDKIKQMRAAGLATKAGEFSPENIAFKILRNSGYLKKMMDMKTKAFNTFFSLNEAASPKYEYGCLMAFFRPPFWEKLLSIIDPEDVYEGDGGFGLEQEPHVTVLFGFHPDKADPKKIKAGAEQVLGGEELKFSLGEASLFDNPLYDVLKFDISDDAGLLGKLNAYMCENHEYTNDYPEYHPHCTIAYIKKGEGQKYADAINEARMDLTVVPEKMVYSMPPRKKFFWKLGGQQENALELGDGLEDMTPEKVEIIKDFISFTQQKLKISGRVYVSLRAGRDEYIQTTAAYAPDEDKNFIRCNGRALVDILRSIGHEMVHNKQREAGIIKPGVEIQNIGGSVEGAANSVAGILIKDFTHNHGYDHIYDL